jgi:hypothetical protein
MEQTERTALQQEISYADFGAPRSDAYADGLR